MVKRIGSSRKKTRNLYSVPKKMKGKIAVSGYIKKFAIGDQVLLNAQPAIIDGIYFRRFHGRIGKVVGTQGTCYLVNIKDGGKNKNLLIGPIHLKAAFIQQIKGD